MSKVRVVVADDHSIVRTGLVSLLGAKKGFEVVGEAANGEEAVVSTEEACEKVHAMIRQERE